MRGIGACAVRHKSQRWRGRTPCGTDAEDGAHGARQAQRAAAPGAARARRRAQLAAARLNITAAWLVAARLVNTILVDPRQSGRLRPAGADSAADRRAANAELPRDCRAFELGL